MAHATTEPTPLEEKRERENRTFFGGGEVFQSYCEEPDYRTGEQYLFDSFLKPEGNLLDIGCGSGRTSFLLAGRFAELDAFDIVPEMIAFASRRQQDLGTKVRLFVGDSSALPFARECYDNAIFAYNGIEAIPTESRRRAALTEVYRVLRPGGRFIFSTKSCFNLRYFRTYHLHRAVRRLGLPFFPESATLGPGEVFVQQGTQKTRYHASNPFRVKRLLREIGFEIIYFNSEVRLGAQRLAPSFRAHFDRWDHFFVCQK